MYDHDHCDTDPAVSVSLLCHKGGGTCIKLRELVNMGNTNLSGIPTRKSVISSRDK